MASTIETGGNSAMDKAIHLLLFRQIETMVANLDKEEGNNSIQPGSSMSAEAMPPRPPSFQEKQTTLRMKAKENQAQVEQFWGQMPWAGSRSCSG